MEPLATQQRRERGALMGADSGQMVGTTTENLFKA